MRWPHQQISSLLRFHHLPPLIENRNGARHAVHRKLNAFVHSAEVPDLVARNGVEHGAYSPHTLRNPQMLCLVAFSQDLIS